jgi:Na+/alanine symporter
MGITGYMIIRKCGIVLGANWYGKAATTLVVTTMTLHLLWYNINPIVSTITITLTAASILLSLALYAKRNFEYLLKGKTEETLAK